MRAVVLSLMLKHLMPLSLLILTVCSVSGILTGEPIERGDAANQVLASDLVERNGVTYQVGSDEPFTGRSVKFFESGQLQNRTDYRNGKKEGLSDWFWENGNLGQRAHLKEGKKDGLLEAFYESGELSIRVPYKDGKKHGLLEAFRKDGKVSRRVHFKDGMRVN